jgi:hypothetical protein
VWRHRVDGAIAQMLTTVQRDVNVLTSRRTLRQLATRLGARARRWFGGEQLRQR